MKDLGNPLFAKTLSTFLSADRFQSILVQSLCTSDIFFFVLMTITGIQQPTNIHLYSIPSQVFIFLWNCSLASQDIHVPPAYTSSHSYHLSRFLKVPFISRLLKPIFCNLERIACVLRRHGNSVSILHAFFAAAVASCWVPIFSCYLESAAWSSHLQISCHFPTSPLYKCARKDRKS